LGNAVDYRVIKRLKVFPESQIIIARIVDYPNEKEMIRQGDGAREIFPDYNVQ
jgi:hypothetical protein